MFKISFLFLIATMPFVTLRAINSNIGYSVDGEDIQSNNGFGSLFQSVSRSIGPNAPVVVYFKGGILILQEIGGKLEGEIHWDQNSDDYDYEVRHSFIGKRNAF